MWALGLGLVLGLRLGLAYRIRGVGLGFALGCGAGMWVGIEVRMWDVRKCALFTGGSCGVVGKHCRWKAAVWSPTG